MSKQNKTRVIVESILPGASEKLLDVSRVYKEVFAGFPWYEDKVCSGIRTGECKVQYTPQKLPKKFEWAFAPGKNEGVVGDVNFDSQKNCIICNRILIDFYPDFVDQDELIAEATGKEGFIGYVLRDEDLTPIGFSWGYKLPEERTKSVDFPAINPLLQKLSINPSRAFYGAELGIVDKRRREGLGFLASATRINAARLVDYEWFVVRTKNEAALSILKRVFSNQIKGLFDDPERGTPWYACNFKDFDKPGVQKKLEQIAGT